MFGQKCDISPPQKRAKQVDDIPTLMAELKHQVELFPHKEKEAWVVASEKARASESVDRRIYIFLKREDLDP